MSINSEPTVTSGILLSDMSIIEQGTKKRSIIGCFDQLAFNQFPAQVGRFFVTSWITNVEGTASELDLTTRIEEKTTGHVVFSSSAKIQFQKEASFERDRVLAISTAVVGTQFHTPGTYTVVLLFNSEEAGRRDFRVKQVSKPAIDPPSK